MGVMGKGDVKTGEDGKGMVDERGVEGVMMVCVFTVWERVVMKGYMG